MNNNNIARRDFIIKVAQSLYGSNQHSDNIPFPLTVQRPKNDDAVTHAIKTKVSLIVLVVVLHCVENVHQKYQKSFFMGHVHNMLNKCLYFV